MKKDVSDESITVRVPSDLKDAAMEAAQGRLSAWAREVLKRELGYTKHETDRP